MKSILISGLALVLTLSFGISAHAQATHDLSIGSRGEEVTWLQNYLIDADTGAAARALAQVGATGYFGTMTRAALAEFQSAKGISPARGYYGPKTRAVINEVSEGFFTGTISAVDTGCFVDAACTVTVDGKKVIILTGMRILGAEPPEVGSLKGVDSIGDLEKMKGQEARVYAAKLADGSYTLYGKSEYYVEVLGKLPANGQVTVSGKIVCLPAKDPNVPTIKLCALGLYGEDGRYYALRAEDGVEILQNGESVVEVTGDFIRGENGHPSFLADGTIEVERIEEAK